jgi:predicted nucleic acid-binding protein
VAYYLDTSAFLKLVVNEPESRALRTWAKRVDAEFFASELLRTESLRAARRASARVLREARKRLDLVTLVVPTAEICDRAADLDPAILRSLDAIHLATALALGDELEGVVTYDVRMAAGAKTCGLEVLAPS